MRGTAQFLSLTGLTALEAVRQPVCLLLTATCVILTALTPLVVMHKFGEDGKLVRDSGLALHFVFGLLVAGTAAGSSLARERRSGTAAAVLSKPVGRAAFFLSKYAGVALAVLLFSLCALLATLLSERVAERFYSTSQFVGYVTDVQTGVLTLFAVAAALLFAGLLNYARHRPFTSTAAVALPGVLLLVVLVAGCFDRSGHLDPYRLQLDPRILPAAILVTLALLVLAALALTLSTRLSPLPALTVCLIVFLAGLMSDYMLGRHVETSAMAAAAYRLLPNWQHFWLVDALSGNGRIPWSYVLTATGYAATWTGGLLCLGCASFRHAEVR